MIFSVMFNHVTCIIVGFFYHFWYAILRHDSQLIHANYLTICGLPSIRCTACGHKNALLSVAANVKACIYMRLLCTIFCFPEPDHKRQRLEEIWKWRILKHVVCNGYGNVHNVRRPDELIGIDATHTRICTYHNRTRKLESTVGAPVYVCDAYYYLRVRRMKCVLDRKNVVCIFNLVKYDKLICCSF